MIERIEKLVNSTNKEDILLAMHMVKHHTNIQSPVVIMWWIERRCKHIYHIIFRTNHMEFVTNYIINPYHYDSQFIIYHSELN